MKILPTKPIFDLFFYQFSRSQFFTIFFDKNFYNNFFIVKFKNKIITPVSFDCVLECSSVRRTPF